MSGALTYVLAMLLNSTSGGAGTVALAEPPQGQQAAYDARATAKAKGLGFESTVDSPPKVKKRARPHYPESAFRACTEGTVLLAIGISESGAVVAPEVVQSVPGLDDAALECVRQWRFRPATKAGRAVGVVAFVPIAFKITSCP